MALLDTEFTVTESPAKGHALAVSRSGQRRMLLEVHEHEDGTAEAFELSGWLSTSTAESRFAAMRHSWLAPQFVLQMSAGRTLRVADLRWEVRCERGSAPA